MTEQKQRRFLEAERREIEPLRAALRNAGPEPIDYAARWSEAESQLRNSREED